MFDNVWTIWKLTAGPVQASSLSYPACEPNRLRTITIMKSVRFTYSLHISYYALVRKVIKLLTCLALIPGS